MKRPASPVCAACAKPILKWAGRGRPPKYHEACDPVPRKRPRAARDRLIPAQPSQQTRTRRAKAEGEQRAAVAADVSAARELAVALRLEPDPARAVRLIGLTPEGNELAALMAEASGEHLQGLRSGAQAETAKTVSAAIALGAERMLRHIREIPVSQLALTLKNLSTVLDSLGGNKLQYAAVSVTFHAPPPPEQT